jgi:hypothetical protein
MAVLAVVLLAVNQEHPAVYVTLVSIVFAFGGAISTAMHHRGH